METLRNAETIAVLASAPGCPPVTVSWVMPQRAAATREWWRPCWLRTGPGRVTVSAALMRPGAGVCIVLEREIEWPEGHQVNVDMVTPASRALSHLTRGDTRR